MTSKIRFAVALLACSLSAAAADSQEYSDVLSPNTCMDQKGYESCLSDAAEGESDCIQSHCQDKNADCYNICSCNKGRQQIQCAATHCWNRVYTCEYENTMLTAMEDCSDPHLETMKNIPLLIAPDNAPQQCSCNIGKLSAAINADLEDYASKQCVDVVHHGADAPADVPRACQCCIMSHIFSAYSNICPDTQPNLLGRDIMAKALLGTNDVWNNKCETVMAKYPCGADGLGFKIPGGEGKLFSPNEIPVDGTKTLSNAPGTITSPVSATITWSQDHQVVSFTVASADAKATGKSGSGNSGNSDKGSGKDDKGNDKNSDDHKSDDTNSGAASLGQTRSFLAAVAVVAVAAVL
ncbi:hypothetical protein NLG97_g2453 [Lecanicillium saksenae]|uniref:Uncharacterized protein n=1 Tax=Lecanicillium saksenae TaxID=468837 RepID=A0ACC1R2L8_9HYPO|nr:hypothetical protein NLG97_g2453 [Lecanicillium saksenae]